MTLSQQWKLRTTQIKTVKLKIQTAIDKTKALWSPECSKLWTWCEWAKRYGWSTFWEKKTQHQSIVVENMYVKGNTGEGWPNEKCFLVIESDIKIAEVWEDIDRTKSNVGTRMVDSKQLEEKVKKNKYYRSKVLVLLVDTKIVKKSTCQTILNDNYV